MPAFAGQAEYFPVHAPAVGTVGNQVNAFFSFMPPSDPGDTVSYGAVLRTPRAVFIALPTPFVADFPVAILPLTTAAQIRVVQFTPEEVGDHMLVCYAINSTAPNVLEVFGVALISIVPWAANMDAKVSDVKRVAMEVSRVRTLIKRM